MAKGSGVVSERIGARGGERLGLEQPGGDAGNEEADEPGEEGKAQESEELEVAAEDPAAGAPPGKEPRCPETSTHDSARARNTKQQQQAPPAPSKDKVKGGRHGRRRLVTLALAHAFVPEPAPEAPDSGARDAKNTARRKTPPDPWGPKN